MKKLYQYIQDSAISQIDAKLEKYLLEDLRLLIDCYQKCKNPDYIINESYIFEGITQLDNFREIFNIVAKFLIKNIKEDFKDGETYTINVSPANGYFKYVVIKLKHSKDNSLSASYDKSITTNEKVHLTLKLHELFKDWIFNIGGLIMHELLHAYEDCERKLNGKPSIFDELSEEYFKAYNSLRHPNETTRQIAILKYFFNPKERNAYISTLELDIEKVVRKYKEDLKNFQPSKILEKLKKETIWKTYFDFGAFVANDMNNIEDYELEAAYYEVTVTEEQKRKDSNKYLALVNKAKKEGKKWPKKEFEVKAKEIRKMSKKVFDKFNKKFDESFIKVLGIYVEKYAPKSYYNKV